MASEPLVSVLLPAFNAEKYICRSIDSILSQTYLNFELIIINDGSTDKTESLVLSYKDDRLKLVSLKENLGIIKALNKGLSIAKGKYLARMDDDDISLPQRFSRQVDFLECNPEYVACGSSIVNFNDSGSSKMDYPTENNQIISSLKLFERNICHPSVMIRLETIQANKIQYRSDYTHAEDYVFWIELSNYGKLYNFKECLIWYYRHSEQLSSKYYSLQLEVSRKIVESNINDFFLLKMNRLEPSVYIDLLVQESGNTSRYLSPLDARLAFEDLLLYSKVSQDMDLLHSKKILLFKLLRASFQYKYSFFNKLKALIFCVVSSPKLTIKNCIEIYQLYSVRKIKIGSL